MRRVIRIHLIAAAAAALLAGTACHSPVSEHWGEVYTANMSQQIANPAAGNQPADPNPGADGPRGTAARGHGRVAQRESTTLTS